VFTLIIVFTHSDTVGTNVNAVNSVNAVSTLSGVNGVNAISTVTTGWGVKL
jgi:hypothetical protein